MAHDWPIPVGLDSRGKAAAETILQFLTDKGLLDHGGGGKFYSPEEWADRGEEYGLSSLLIITHDGGDHAAAFNPDYEAYALMEALRAQLQTINMFPEQCTSWYTSIHAS